ncbi:hypothetical protein CYMTET_47723 [Cymbomonas tetramitiformis]|uniref:Uncharacterized protein n=1 Tax=Cymbomonas tetramitiformis TaxID=36881 RepID=A0AAE0BUZ3_9CHLO|nr:hypothetical protein CYMTET_47723 [Cymbomonas tetramitiformis]
MQQEEYPVFLSGYAQTDEIGQSGETCDEEEPEPLEKETSFSRACDLKRLSRSERNKLMTGYARVLGERNEAGGSEKEICPLLVSARLNDILLARSILNVDPSNLRTLGEAIKEASERHHLRFVDEAIRWFTSGNPSRPDLVDIATMAGNTEAAHILKRPRGFTEAYEYGVKKIRLVHGSTVRRWLKHNKHLLRRNGVSL